MYILTVIDPDLGDMLHTAQTMDEVSALLHRYLHMETVLRVIVETKE